jgi:hypothetical protein
VINKGVLRFSAGVWPLTRRMSGALLYTCTEHKAPHNIEVHRSLQNCGSSKWILLYFALLVPRIWRWVIRFWEKKLWAQQWQHSLLLRWALREKLLVALLVKNFLTSVLFSVSFPQEAVMHSSLTLTTRIQSFPQYPVYFQTLCVIFLPSVLRSCKWPFVFYSGLFLTHFAP